MDQRALRFEVIIPTGEIAYALVFRSEAIVLIELALPTYRVSMYGENVNKQQRSLDLDLLEEKRIAAQLNAEAFKQKTKLTHDNKLVSRPIHIGVWVLRKIEGTARQIRANRLTLNSEGPYLFKEEIWPGTFHLMDKDGKILPNPWHTNHLKKYYV